MAAMIQLPIGSEDDPTTTPDFTTYQKYFSSSYSPDGGVGLNAVQSTLGVAGKGIRIADIEYNWNLNHEDIGLPISTIIDTAPLYDPFPQDQSNHGTAVLGMLKGRKNAYGIDGFSPKAQIYLAPAMTQTYGYNVARAINLVAASLREGDVMLIEQQTYVCNGSNYGPIEWILPIFDAISLATAKGIVVIEPAGNGNQNLDDVSCEGRFDLSVRDSGALMIGAGHSSQHSRLSYSSYGLRVNLQGWGNSVASTGYGTLYDPGDILRRYTQYFNGTSSASAMVAGALTSLQGMAQGVGFKPLKPDCLNELVALTGSLQTGDLSTNIGQLPDLEAAMQVMVSGGLQCMERCTDSDGDLACDTIDNCATVTNPLQQTVNCTGNGGGRMKRIPY